MGGGSWTKKSFSDYSTSRGRTVVDNVVVTHASAQEMFISRSVDSALNPYRVIRESCDSVEHPNSKPVIIGIDVTGSMGQTAVEVAKKISQVITIVLESSSDIQVMVMGIGDVGEGDQGPIQISQFESDIRIAEQLDKIWFEGRGGGNEYESYTAAWYMGSRHTKLDCLTKRGHKGLIITLGDEKLNPYIPGRRLAEITGDELQGDIETPDLYREASEKFGIYHIHVNHGPSSQSREDGARRTFTNCIGKDNFRVTTVNGVADEVTDIITSFFGNTPINESQETVQVNPDGKISWNVD